MRWGKDSAGSLRFILYRAIASQDHRKVELIPPNLELGPVGGDTPAPSLPISLPIHPVGRDGHTYTSDRGIKEDNDTHAEQPGMKRAMKQALYEMRRIHSARSEVKVMSGNTTC